MTRLATRCAPREINSNVIQQPVKQVEIIGAKTSATFNGSFAEALARLRSCEGSYTSDTGNGYYGAYQFDKSTWGNFGGYNNPAQAPADIQDQTLDLHAVVPASSDRQGNDPGPLGDLVRAQKAL